MAAQRPSASEHQQGSDLLGEIREIRKDLNLGLSGVHARLDGYLKSMSEVREKLTVVETRQNRVMTDLVDLEKFVRMGLQEVRDRQTVIEQKAEDIAESAALKVIETMKGKSALKVLAWIGAGLLTLLSWLWVLIKTGQVKLPANP